MACTWKNRDLLPAFWDKISTFYLGQTEHGSARGDGPLCARIALLLASFDVALPSEREKPSWIDWTIEISPSTRWVLLGLFPGESPRACRIFERAITQPIVHNDPWRMPHDVRDR